MTCLLVDRGIARDFGPHEGVLYWIPNPQTNWNTFLMPLLVNEYNSTCWSQTGFTPVVGTFNATSMCQEPSQHLLGGWNWLVDYHQKLLTCEDLVPICTPLVFMVALTHVTHMPLETYNQTIMVIILWINMLNAASSESNSLAQFRKIASSAVF